MAFLRFPLPAGPLRGRDKEVRALHDRVRALSEGESGVVLVAGDAGTGKSRILLDAVVAATALGAAVAVATADEQAHLVPLSPLVTAIGPSIGTPPPGDPGLWVFKELRATLEDRATTTPILVAIDDLHRADQPTLQALQSLPRQLDAYPVLWLLAGTPGRSGSPLDRLFRQLADPGMARLELGPLDPAAVAAMIRDVLGAEPDRELLLVAGGAEGNPALILELIEGLREEGAVEVTAGVTRLVSGHVPQRLEALVAYRLGRLSADTRRLVEVASVFGRSFSIEDVSEVLVVPPGGLLGALEDARNAGVLVAAHGALGFRHELVRWAVYEGIPASIRTALHRQIGELLLARGGSAVEAADHLVEGTVEGDSGALSTLDVAAVQLGGSSPEAAADMALDALRLTSEDDPLRLRRSLAAVDALASAGRLDRATSLAQTVLDGPDGSAEDSGHLQVIKARFMLLRNRPADAVAAAQAVIEGGEVSQAVFGAAEVTRLFALLTEGELQYARPLAEALLAGTDARGGAAAFVGALTALARIAWTDGRVADALGLVRAAVRRSEDAPPGAHRIHSLLTLATLLACTGDFEEADDVIELARDDEGHAGEPLWTALVPYARARVHLAAGRLSDAADEAHHSLSLAEAVGATLAVPANEWVLASVSLLDGDLDDAAGHVQRYTAGPAPVAQAPSSATYRFTAARVAEARGEDAAAARLFDPIYADSVPRAQLFAVDATSAPCLVRRALRAGDRQAAEAVVAQAQLVSAGSPGVTALDAGAAHARGIVGRDVDALDDAARRHRFPWGRASALEDGAAVLTARDAVRARLEGSLSSYEEIGAMRDADRVRGRLQQADRRPRRAPSPVEGWASLTDTERRVSRLVARGLTNSEVAQGMTLSRHTVDYHLRVVFRKLHINSRVELTRMTLRHDEG